MRCWYRHRTKGVKTSPFWLYGATYICTETTPCPTSNGIVLCYESVVFVVLYDLLVIPTREDTDSFYRYAKAQHCGSTKRSMRDVGVG